VPAARVDELQSAFTGYFDLARATSARLIAGEAGEEVVAALESMTTRYNDVHEMLVSATADDQQAMAAAFVAARENQTTSMWLIVGVTVLCLVSLALLSSWLGRQITSPILRLSEATRKIAAEDMTLLATEADLIAGGDLTRSIELHFSPVPVETEDEVGQMAASFNTMLEKLSAVATSFGSISSGLREIVFHVQGAANEVAAGSERVVKASSAAAQGNDSAVGAVESISATLQEFNANLQNVARSTQSQAASSLETLHSIKQLLASVGDVQGTAGRLVELARSSNAAVRDGESAMVSASDAIGRMREVNRASATLVERLGGTAKGIGKIVEVIDDIAEQTNLLSLNAAIEAARAGEHGMGFAIVADEVRKLAERSARSTEEISRLITDIQGQVGETVQNMEASIAGVEEGMERTAVLRSNLARIGQSVAEVFSRSNEIGEATKAQSAGANEIEQRTSRLSDLTHEISSATEQQSNGTSQIVDAIEHIRHMVQENSNGVGELVSSAEQLSHQANQMRDVASRFRVGHGLHHRS
jgi:methyl-accepting chemotaxis protein